jgi:hypothetical protein
MPNVFEVLRADHHDVKAMLIRLESGPQASLGATAEQIAQRKHLVDELIIEQSRHEAAEQQYFWPMVRALGPEGDRVADQGLEQEAQGESVLNELDKLDPDDERFESVLAALISDGRAHIAFEEAHAWPLLGAALSAEQAEELGDKISGDRPGPRLLGPLAVPQARRAPVAPQPGRGVFLPRLSGRRRARARESFP